MIEHCEKCGHKLANTRHNLSERHVRALYKLRQAVKFYNRNEIHLRKDMTGKPFELLLDEITNMSKLRYHALVFQVKVNGKRKGGYWGITAKGGAFLRGETSCRKYVLTRNDQVVGHEGPEIMIWGIDNGAWWERPETTQAEKSVQQTLT